MCGVSLERLFFWIAVWLDGRTRRSGDGGGGGGKGLAGMRHRLCSLRPRVGQPSLLWSFGWQAVACEGCPPEPCAKAGVFNRPYSLQPRVGRIPLPSTSKNEGMARRWARHSVVTRTVSSAWRLPALHRECFKNLGNLRHL